MSGTTTIYLSKFDPTKHNGSFKSCYHDEPTCTRCDTIVGPLNEDIVNGDVHDEACNVCEIIFHCRLDFETGLFFCFE